MQNVHSLQIIIYSETWELGTPKALEGTEEKCPIF